MKPKTLSKLKLEADKWYSWYVRARDSYVRDDGVRVAKCITCSNEYPTEQMQAGHFISRRISALRFVDANVNAQCVRCNVFHYGEQYQYGLEIDSKYGNGTARELHRMKNDYHKFTREELEGIIKEAKEYVAEYAS